MHDLDTRAGTEAAGEGCRRVAERLRLSAVGVLATDEGRRRSAWWVSPGSGPVPARLEDVLEGRAEGWIAARLPDGTVFGRLTPESLVTAAEELDRLGTALIDALMGRSTDLPLRDEVRPSDSAAADSELAVLERVAGALRDVLSVPAAALPDLLDAVRGALGADEVYLLRERGADVAVAASPDGDWPRRIPPEIRSGFQELPAVVENGTARQLGIVLGARTQLAGATFREDDSPAVVVLAGRAGGPPPSGELMRLVGNLIAAGRTALEWRHRAVDALMLQERTRWAAEIHDGLVQAVTSAVIEVQMLRRRMDHDPEGAVASVHAAEQEIRRSLGELRGMLFDLSEAGTAPADDQPLSEYIEQVAARWRLRATAEIDGDLGVAPGEIRAAAYTVLREGLANAAKHSASANVVVMVSVGADGVRLSIEDSGAGFDPATAKMGHLGLELMRRRIAEVNGTLDIESSVGNGTRVVAWLPVRGEGATT
ncbi:MAG TPA: ATP-binding protein [Actinomycetota bacterium]|nr:ATP-binding protein [Actinomycetota bacterium]